jgi:hypothetical protein
MVIERPSEEYQKKKAKDDLHGEDSKKGRKESREGSKRGRKEGRVRREKGSEKDREIEFSERRYVGEKW